MADRHGRRVNTVCVVLVRGALSSSTMQVLLPSIIRDVYGIPNEELYGVAVNGVYRIFIKFKSAGFYSSIVDAFQEKRMTVNSAVEICLHDVSSYVTWVKMNTRSNKEELGRNWLKEVIKPGLQASQVIGIYNDASKIYDQYTVDCKYQGPTIMAEEVARLVAEELRHEVRVLDVGAGTGLLGRELHKLGFSNIDALEPSEGMMNILKNTGHYRVKYQELMVVGQHTVPQDTYDLLVMCGSMAPGHIPAECVEDFIRVTKPGGWVVLLIRLEYLLTAEDYKDKLEAHMNRLQKENMWCKEVRKVVPNYCTDHEGVLFIYRVL